MTTSGTLATFLSAFLFLQGPAASKPLQIGPVVLNDEELATLTRLIPETRTPWLIDGNPEPLTADRENFQAFLPPASSNSTVRRGSFVFLSRRRTGPPDWRAYPAQNYAQVALAGRRSDDVRSADDVNRPFAVRGNFSDDELVSIVAFVRATFDSTRPLSRIEGEGGYVKVIVRLDSSSGRWAELERDGQNWKIVRQGTVHA